MNAICIYHGNCADGFGAAWVVRKALGENVEFFAGTYGNPPPDVSGRDVLIVDFSYKRDVLDEMARTARTLLVIDHHKTAAADLAHLTNPPVMRYTPDAWRSFAHMDHVPAYAIFDMSHSGAMLAWRFFFPDAEPPQLLRHIEDRDLWRFWLDGTRAVQACVFSHPYDFDRWDYLVNVCQDETTRARMIAEGEAIERKHFKDVDELLSVCTRHMVIGGIEVPVANLPYTMASDAAGTLAEGRPFAATYFDTPEGRVFSLRSRGEDATDVSAIAQIYGGGGHRNAAGFRMPAGWEGDTQPVGQ